MKIFKSIKWRLQLWYGLILVFVLAGFGFTAYQLERGRLFARIDDGLHRRIGVLANTLRRPPPRGPGRSEQPFDRPPPGQFPNAGPPPLQKDWPVPEFHLPSEDNHFFDASDPNNFYFIIKTRAGKEFVRSTNVPPIPAEVYSIKPQPPDSRTQLTTVDFGNYRAIPNVLPSGEIIWVGCSIAPELTELRLTAVKLTGFGGIILFFGLVGGGWLVGRALRPIDDISAAAVKISAGDLSQRINVAETESELGQLAACIEFHLRPAGDRICPAATVHRRRRTRTAHAGLGGTDPNPDRLESRAQRGRISGNDRSLPTFSPTNAPVD